MFNFLGQDCREFMGPFGGRGNIIHQDGPRHKRPVSRRRLFRTAPFSRMLAREVIAGIAQCMRQQIVPRVSRAMQIDLGLSDSARKFSDFSRAVRLGDFERERFRLFGIMLGWKQRAELTHDAARLFGAKPAADWSRAQAYLGDRPRKRTPAPPPFSSRKSTPACSKARLMTWRVALRG